MAEPTTPIFARALAAPTAEKGAAMRLGPLTLDGGRTLPEFTLAYMTYGALNADRSNAILVCHALTGDQFAASISPVTGKDGWWDEMVGPDKPIDTNRFFVICANVLGGCLGSTGPSSNDPATGRPYALGFPLITVRDMVRAQALLLDALNIEKLFCVTGGSMGGMQALEWAATFPNRVARALPIATAARHTAQNIALHEVGRQAIMNDPAWDDGCYGDVQPGKGLAVARMVGHISYLSEMALERKFGRNLQNRAALSFGFERDFQVESYLHHQGTSFVERFDANSYLYITRAMDYFDLATEHGGDLKKAFANSPVRFQCVSFTSDWLFPTSENKRIAEALPPQNMRFQEIVTDKGHDAFLLDEPELHALVRDFLGSV